MKEIILLMRFLFLRLRIEGRSKGTLCDFKKENNIERLYEREGH